MSREYAGETALSSFKDSKNAFLPEEQRAVDVEQFRLQHEASTPDARDFVCGKNVVPHETPIQETNPEDEISSSPDLAATRTETISASTGPPGGALSESVAYGEQNQLKKADVTTTRNHPLAIRPKEHERAAQRRQVKPHTESQCLRQRRLQLIFVEDHARVL